MVKGCRGATINNISNENETAKYFYTANDDDHID